MRQKNNRLFFTSYGVWAEYFFGYQLFFWQPKIFLLLWSVFLGLKRVLWLQYHLLQLIWSLHLLPRAIRDAIIMIGVLLELQVSLLLNSIGSFSYMCGSAFSTHALTSKMLLLCYAKDMVYY